MSGEAGKFTPRIFKIPWTGPSKFVTAQAMPDDYQEYIRPIPEAMAARGFPDDESGEATLAVFCLLLRYLDATTKVDTCTILVPKYFPTSGKKQRAGSGPKGQSKGKGKGKGATQEGPNLQVIPEYFAVTLLRHQGEKGQFAQDLRLGSLAGYNSTQSVNGWRLQIALTVDALRQAHPEPVITPYYGCRIQGLRAGHDLRVILEALLQNPDNDLHVVIAAFIRRGARTIVLGDQTLVEDHLYLVYPHENDPPFVMGDEPLRQLSHGEDGRYFHVQVDGALIPGWKRMQDFYNALAKHENLNKQLHIGMAREGFQVAVKGAAPLPTSVIPATKELITLRKEISSELQELQNRREVGMRKEFASRSDMESLVRSIQAPLLARMEQLEQSAATKQELHTHAQVVVDTMVSKQVFEQAVAAHSNTLQGLVTCMANMDATLRNLGCYTQPPQDPRLLPGDPRHSSGPQLPEHERVMYLDHHQHDSHG